MQTPDWPDNLPTRSRKRVVLGMAAHTDFTKPGNTKVDDDGVEDDQYPDAAPDEHVTPRDSADHAGDANLDSDPPDATNWRSYPFVHAKRAGTRRAPTYVAALVAACSCAAALAYMNLQPNPGVAEIQTAALSQLVIQQQRTLDQTPGRLLPLCILTRLAQSSPPSAECRDALVEEVDADHPMHHLDGVIPSETVRTQARQVLLEYRETLFVVAQRSGILEKWAFHTQPVRTQGAAAHLEMAVSAMQSSGACRVNANKKMHDICEFIPRRNS